MYIQDLCHPNVLAAAVGDEVRDSRLTAGRVYIIDFDRSRQLELKPGAQGAVALPPTVCRPPPGITHLDPYSWDMYCVGTLLLWYLRVRQRALLMSNLSLTILGVVWRETAPSSSSAIRTVAYR